ncbi:conserved hypothetical protein [Ricinus communis]|uniref:Uncharacterized protein n=1 Tax=Ricinus communis TaxID=3988 RepID=B9S838_RICCO|nr:conserved hypothetical protein [Ricinus communis]
MEKRGSKQRYLQLPYPGAANAGSAITSGETASNSGFTKPNPISIGIILGNQEMST